MASGRPSAVGSGCRTGRRSAARSSTCSPRPTTDCRHFTVAAMATTAANGSWSATLPAGPSRLVEAAYPGAANARALALRTGDRDRAREGRSCSACPTASRVGRDRPDHGAAGRRVSTAGRRAGAPTDRPGLGAITTYGVQEHVTGNGRFSTTYTFGAGDASVHRSYWFQIATLPMGGDFPCAPADVRNAGRVLVGGHPTSCSAAPPPPPPAQEASKRR